MMISYNISRELLAEAVKVTPGKRAPTLTALDNCDGKSSLYSPLSTEIKASLLT